MYKAVVRVNLKRKILDPQGKAIESSLHNLGFLKLSGVRTGKMIEFTVEEPDQEKAMSLIQAACAKLLSNPVTEDYDFDLIDEAGIAINHFSSARISGFKDKVN